MESANMNEQQEYLDENTEVRELLARLLDAKRMITAMVMANGGQFVLTVKDYEMAKVHTESLKLVCNEVNRQWTYTVEMKNG